jgi:hypothetical protein
MSWNFMDPASRANIDRVWRQESQGMLALASDPDVWEAPTGAGHWQVREVEHRQDRLLPHRMPDRHLVRRRHVRAS